MRTLVTNEVIDHHFMELCKQIAEHWLEGSDISPTTKLMFMNMTFDYYDKRHEGTPS